jgi:hypothetical protein
MPRIELVYPAIARGIGSGRTGTESQGIGLDCDSNVLFLDNKAANLRNKRPPADSIAQRARFEVKQGKDLRWGNRDLRHERGLK